MKRLKFALGLFIITMLMSVVLFVVGNDSPILVTASFMIFISQLLMVFKTFAEIDRMDKE